MMKTYFHVLYVSLVLLPLIQLTEGTQIRLSGHSASLNSPGLQNQAPPPTLRNESGSIITPEFSEYVEGLRSKWGIPGITVGVVHSGGTVEVGAWGERTEDGDLMTPDTLFNIASCSKAFAASAIGILMEDFAHGKNVTSLPTHVKQLDWETKVVDLLPGDWQLMDEWTTKKANIRDVMSHVSGLPRHDFSYRAGDTPLNVIRRMRHLRPAYELRQEWSYNNQMYMLASYLVSKYSGQPYIDFIQARIFTALQMSSTTFFQNEISQSQNLSQSWTQNRCRIPFWFSDPLVAELNSGPAAIISNVEDMVRWVKVLLGEGVDPESEEVVIPRDGFREITGAHVILNSSPKSEVESISGYGMGWIRESYRGFDVVSHPGGVPGFSTRVGFLPQHDLGAVILVNRDAMVEPIIDLLHHVIDLRLGSDCNNDTIPSRSVVTMPEPISLKKLTPLSLPLEAYTGTYSDIGYGNITLCSVVTNTPYCKRVLKDFEPFRLPNHSFNNSLDLYASFNTTWSSHIRLNHQEGDTFGITMTYLFPEGYGKNKTAFESWERGTSEGLGRFVVGDGGFSGVEGFGTFLVEGRTERQRVGSGVKDVADVWFAKVQVL